MDLRAITLRKAKGLRRLADELEKLTPEDSKVFTCKGAKCVNAENNHNSFVTELQRIYDKDHFYVYYLEIDKRDIDHVFEAYKRARNKIDRALPRINTPSSTLYVGSSRTNLLSRIKQHLGFTEAKGIYALHLIHVAPRLKFRVTILKFYKIEPSLLQIYEDALHETLKPMFGRKGAK